jgi:hypothetical protein
MRPNLRLPINIADELAAYFATAESDFGVQSTFQAFVNMIVRGGPGGSANQEGQIRDERFGFKSGPRGTGCVGKARRVYAALREVPASTTVLYAAHGPTDWGRLIDSAFGRGMATKVAKAIGPYPGVALLTEAVRRKPYSVILLDEVEKAHPQIFNTLLQVLDDGRLTDGKGKTVNFKNTIIILTSNLGSEAFQVEKYSREMVELKVTDVIRSFFKPEFLNRLDNIVIFNPLSEPMMKAIITLQLKAVETRLDKQGYRFKAQDSLEKYLLSEGFDTLYGARPLKRVINEHILDEIALQIVEGKVQKGDLLTAGVKAGKVTIEAKRVN